MKATHQATQADAIKPHVHMSLMLHDIRSILSIERSLVGLFAQLSLGS